MLPRLTHACYSHMLELMPAAAVASAARRQGNFRRSWACFAAPVVAMPVGQRYGRHQLSFRWLGQVGVCSPLHLGFRAYQLRQAL